MSFRFTPGCCCQSKCPTCRELIDSGAELPSVPLGEATTVLEQIKRQRGRSCQYGYMSLYSVSQDGIIYGRHEDLGSMVLAVQPTTYFDNQTGRTKLDSNGNIVSQSTLSKFMDVRTAMGHTVYASWQKCGFPDNNFSTFAIGFTKSELLIDSPKFEPSSITDDTETNSVGRLEGESVEAWYARAKGKYRVRVHFDITAKAKIVLTFTPGHRDVSGRIIKRCIRTCFEVSDAFSDNEAYGNNYSYTFRWNLVDPDPSVYTGILQNYICMIGIASVEGVPVSVEGIFNINLSGWIGSSYGSRTYDQVLTIYNGFLSKAFNSLKSGDHGIQTYEGILHD